MGVKRIGLCLDRENGEDVGEEVYMEYLDLTMGKSRLNLA